MNMDIKLGCYYTLTVDFGPSKITIQDWTLDEAIDSLVKRAKKSHYSIVTEEGVKPGLITVHPEYYAFYECGDERRLIGNTDIELYYKPDGPHKMYFHGSHCGMTVPQILQSNKVECEDPVALSEEQKNRLLSQLEELNSTDEFKKEKERLAELPYQRFSRKLENALEESGFKDPEAVEKLKKFIKSEFDIDIKYSIL